MEDICTVCLYGHFGSNLLFAISLSLEICKNELVYSIIHIQEIETHPGNRNADRFCHVETSFVKQYSLRRNKN